MPPTSFSFNITANRFFASETRPYFTRSREYTDLPVKTFYSRRFSDKMGGGLTYTYQGNQTSVFFQSLRSPITSNIFTGEKSTQPYWFSQLVGNRTFHDSHIQLGVSRLSPRIGLEQSRYHTDLQFMYKPGWRLNAQLSYDNKHSAPVGYLSVENDN